MSNGTLANLGGRFGDVFYYTFLLLLLVYMAEGSSTAYRGYQACRPRLVDMDLSPKCKI